ncbi:DnaJ domain-containing protein [Cynara cardunculus var. scolymus]|uniref:DnaJ domain-containing protein n=1 Tax=Cynara cardunculus var. scolymus TaxID=59895 RepID=A0A118JSK3_CYNCS|nr:DnaJ domain-containing protein [Cynara cardunculus var. scolymus]
MGEASSVDDDLLLKNFYAEVSEVERDNEVARILSCFKLNAFEYLNLPFDSSPEDVKKQYRKLSLLVHPDKCKHPQAKEAFSALAKAQQLLLDPQEREYLVNQINAARVPRSMIKLAFEMNIFLREEKVRNREEKNGVWRGILDAEEYLRRKWEKKMKVGLGNGKNFHAAVMPRIPICSQSGNYNGPRIVFEAMSSDTNLQKVESMKMEEIGIKSIVSDFQRWFRDQMKIFNQKLKEANVGRSIGKWSNEEKEAIEGLQMEAGVEFFAVKTIRDEEEFIIVKNREGIEELRAKRKKQLKKDTASKLKSLVNEGKYEQEYEKSEDFQHKLKLKVRELLTDQEWRRRKMQMRISEEEGRLKKDEEESKEMWKRKREHEEQWEGTRENRVSSWRDFMKGGKKVKKGEIRPPKLKTEDPNKSYVQRPVKRG